MRLLLARVYKYTPNRRWNSCEQTSSKAHLPHSKLNLLSTNRGNRMTERDNKSVKHLEPIARFGRLEISRIAVHQLFTNTLKDADIRISMDGRGRWMDNFALPGNMLKYGPRSSRIGICLGIPGIRAKALVCERALRPIGFIESCVSG